MKIVGSLTSRRYNWPLVVQNNCTPPSKSAISVWITSHIVLSVGEDGSVDSRLNLLLPVRFRLCRPWRSFFSGLPLYGADSSLFRTLIFVELSFRECERTLCLHCLHQFSLCPFPPTAMLCVCVFCCVCCVCCVVCVLLCVFCVHACSWRWFDATIIKGVIVCIYI